MSAMILSPLPAPLISVAEVRLHLRRERDDESPTVLTPTLDEDTGVWSVDTGESTGRFWPRLKGSDASNEVAYGNLPSIDLPEDVSLVVTPEEVAVKAGMTLPLSLDDREAVEDAIRDAQADVEAYLGRPLVPTTYVEQDRLPWHDGWYLVAAPDEPLIRVLSTVVQLDPVDGAVTDYFTVTYLAGIDARNDPALRPIRRYVLAHAMNSPEFTRMWRTRTDAKGVVKNLSAEGQSVTFATPTLSGSETASKPGSGEPGALPTLGSLDRWRVAGRRVHQAPSQMQAWPYGSMGTV